MTDLEYTLRLICQRRGKTLTKIESVAFNVRVAFGLATNTFLLPVVANTFYYIEVLGLSIVTITGRFLLEVTNSGIGSAGVCDIVVGGASSSYMQFWGIETDSFKYVEDTFTAGTVMLLGQVYKVTYS